MDCEQNSDVFIKIVGYLIVMNTGSEMYIFRHFRNKPLE